MNDPCAICFPGPETCTTTSKKFCGDYREYQGYLKGLKVAENLAGFVLSDDCPDDSPSDAPGCPYGYVKKKHLAIPAAIPADCLDCWLKWVEEKAQQ